MNARQELELRKLAVGRRVFLCLDADATRTAVQHAKRLRRVANVVVVRLEEDIKDMWYDCLDDLLGDCIKSL